MSCIFKILRFLSEGSVCALYVLIDIMLLKALNIDKVQNTVNINVLNLYHRIFKIESTARSIMQFLLARYIMYGTTVPGQGSVHRGISS